MVDNFGLKIGLGARRSVVDQSTKNRGIVRALMYSF